MYCKLFASLYQGTLRGASHEILVFTNLLAHASREGIVDKHFRAIAEETGLTIDEVKAAIITLESPDPESRSPEEAGARIVRMDEHRVWGWRIVNYGKYRAIRSEEDRAEQNRLAQERWRNKNKPPSAESKQDKPMQMQMQREKHKQKQEETPLAFPANAGAGFEEVFAKWMKFRRGVGKKPKDWTAMFQAQLDWLSKQPRESWDEIINQSIRNGWQGLFELKVVQSNGFQRPPRPVSERQQKLDREFEEARKSHGT